MVLSTGGTDLAAHSCWNRESYHPPSPCSCLPAYVFSLSTLCQLWCLLECFMLWFNSWNISKLSQGKKNTPNQHIQTPNKRGLFSAYLLNNIDLIMGFCAWETWDKQRTQKEGSRSCSFWQLELFWWFWHVGKSLTYNELGFSHTCSWRG